MAIVTFVTPCEDSDTNDKMIRQGVSAKYRYRQDIETVSQIWTVNSKATQWQLKTWQTFTSE